MSKDSLRSRTIRLASENKALRPHLLRVIQACDACGESDMEGGRKFQKGPGYGGKNKSKVKKPGGEPGETETLPEGAWKKKKEKGPKCWSYLPPSERTESDRCYEKGKTKGLPGSSQTDTSAYNEAYRKRRWPKHFE